MVRTDGIVLSMALLFLCLALCGCGDAPNPAPTPAPPTPAPPTPAPTPAPISPEDAWQRYKTAFQENDIEALRASYWSSNDPDIFQYEVLCWQRPGEEEEKCGRQFSTIGSSTKPNVYNRTTQPVISSAEFDKHPTKPDDYRIASLVWEAQWKGSTGVVADSFGVDILVFERQIDPETRGEDWRVKFHVQVVDSKPTPRAPINYEYMCWEDATVIQEICEKDLNGTVAMFKDNAVIRSYDKDLPTVNGLFTKDQFVNFFDATELFTTDFPTYQVNVLRGGWAGNGLIKDGGAVLTLSGPGNNNYAQFPRRFVTLMFGDDDDGENVVFQFLARWTWAEVVADPATSHVEHI